MSFAILLKCIVRLFNHIMFLYILVNCWQKPLAWTMIGLFPVVLLYGGIALTRLFPGQWPNRIQQGNDVLKKHMFKVKSSNKFRKLIAIFKTNILFFFINQFF